MIRCNCATVIVSERFAARGLSGPAEADPAAASENAFNEQRLSSLGWIFKRIWSTDLILAFSNEHLQLRHPSVDGTNVLIINSWQIFLIQPVAKVHTQALQNQSVMSFVALLFLT